MELLKYDTASLLISVLQYPCGFKNSVIAVQIIYKTDDRKGCDQHQDEYNDCNKGNRQQLLHFNRYRFRNDKPPRGNSALKDLRSLRNHTGNIQKLQDDYRISTRPTQVQYRTPFSTPYQLLGLP
jgi:hypothetical protein